MSVRIGCTAAYQLTQRYRASGGNEGSPVVRVAVRPRGVELESDERPDRVAGARHNDGPSCIRRSDGGAGSGCLMKRTSGSNRRMQLGPSLCRAPAT